VRSVAESHHWHIGDHVPFEFAQTGIVPLRLAAIYDTKLAGEYWISPDAYNSNYTGRLVAQILVRTTGTPRSAIERVTNAYPSAKLENRAEFKRTLNSSVNQIISLVYVLLFLALVIALVGIVNTLALSVMERRREVGLLRAVGMTRRQLRREVRGEAIIIALQGTITGLSLGVLFGWAFSRAARDQGFDRFTLPIGQLLVIAAIGALTGVIAAVLPARRASHLDVLSAIATT
jgi:putative ABC transport system permease protein